jgi:DNA replication protein DnaC
MIEIEHRRELRALDQQDLERMLLPRRFWDCTAEEVCDDSSDELSAREFLRRYFAEFEAYLDMGVGVLLWGANGRGKTGMAAVIAKMARRMARLVLFVECSDLKRMAIDRVVFDEDQTMWERARQVDVLILDDLGKGTTDRTGYGARLVDELIRSRSANLKVTIITTNLNPVALKGALKESTSHTLVDCVIPFHVEGPDRRQTDKERIMALFSASA